MQFSTKGIPCAVLGVVRFGMGVGSRAHILKIRSAKRPFVSRKRSRTGTGFAGREKNYADHRDRGEKELGDLRASQFGSPELLTVIHKALQQLFF